MNHPAVPIPPDDPEVVFAEHRLGEARLAYLTAKRALAAALDELLAAETAVRRATARGSRPTTSRGASAPPILAPGRLARR